MASVQKQSYQNWEVLIVDNASSDDSVVLARQLMPQAKFILNQKNLGFGAGHNLGILRSRGKYILCLNQDVVLHHDFLKEAVATMEPDKEIGALQGKLLKMENREWRIENGETVDTTGLIIYKNRRVVNRGQDEIDQGQYDKEEEIFGADGAAPVYRRMALDDIALFSYERKRDKLERRGDKLQIFLPSFNKGGGGVRGGGSEYFDEDFFAYKEDIDLSWRLRLAGWKIIYQPKAIAWHARGTGQPPGRTDRTVASQRQHLSRFCRQLSWKNHRLMLLKNELSSLFWRHWPVIAWQEFKTTGYIFLREPRLLKSWWWFFRQLPGAWRKRKIIMKKRRVSAQEMEIWFV